MYLNINLLQSGIDLKRICDHFFSSRKEFYIKLDKERDNNLEMKKKILLTLKKFKFQ